MSKKPTEIFLKDYQKPPFLIPEVSLFFDIFPGHTVVKNQSHYVRETPGPLVLNAENMEVLSVKVNEQVLDQSQYKFDTKKNTLTIESVPDEFQLETQVRIKPHENLELAGLYKSDAIFCTQCEPLGFRRITPHLDRPDVMSKFRVRITAERKALPVLLSNGNRIDSGAMEGGRHFVQWEDPIPKPNYLFALVAGDLVCTQDDFTTMSGRVIPLRIYTEEKDKHRVNHAMESLKKAMAWDEERFGREYDLDIFMIVAVDAFNSGAMENKGLNIFNTSAILCDPESSTDANYKYIDRVVAHEYFHNWTGNRITCRDWFQLTLKEGLTVFRDAEYSADTGDRAVKRIEDADDLKTYQFPEDAGPMAHPIRPPFFIQIENFYTMTVYEKGAEVIRMLMTFLGREGFRNGMDRYFERFDGQAVTTEDFISAFEETSGRDFSAFQRSWYDQAGTPKLRYTESFEKGQYQIELTQENEHPTAKNPYHFPVVYGLLDRKTGKEIASGTWEMQQKTETFTLDLAAQKNFQSNEKPVLSILRNFSAPVKILQQNSWENDLFLFAHDTDPYNRFEAGQRLFRRLILDLMQDEKASIPTSVLEAFGAVLRDESLGLDFRARCLGLPDLYSVVSEQKVYDYQSAHTARRILARAIADYHEATFLSIYEKFSKLRYEKTDLAMAQRALKNQALGYLSNATKNFEDLSVAQFEKSDNMTDTMAAMIVLAKNPGNARDKALGAFYEKWKHDPLVMNKWFAVQASSCADDTFQRVGALESDAAFDAENPNKIRSLFGAFGRNFPKFHVADGSGYRFLADKVLQVDKFNKKVAGRLATLFDQFQYLDENRQALMRVELDRILAESKLSDATFEVVDRIRKSA
jgi:aminopeptidase N